MIIQLTWIHGFSVGLKEKKNAVLEIAGIEGLPRSNTPKLEHILDSIIDRKNEHLKPV